MTPYDLLWHRTITIIYQDPLQFTGSPDSTYCAIALLRNHDNYTRRHLLITKRVINKQLFTKYLRLWKSCIRWVRWDSLCHPINPPPPLPHSIPYSLPARTRASPTATPTDSIRTSSTTSIWWTLRLARRHCACSWI